MSTGTSIRCTATRLLFLTVGALLAASAAHATVSISRAELNGTRLRIEGQAIPNHAITVDSVALGTSDAAGFFRIEKDPFATADCIVEVNDGSATPTPASLSGCTVTAPQAAGATGTVSIIRGGNGHGLILSQPAGINCTITDAGGSGTCSAMYAAGTVVRLEARPADDSQFLGWRPTPGCADASKVTVAADTTISCQPVFTLR
jgi:hypothetical protein